MHLDMFCLTLLSMFYWKNKEIHCIIIDGLQSIPRESNDKDVVAMLDELTIEANEESFVTILQHGDNDVTWQ